MEKINMDEKAHKKLRGLIELLQAIELIEYHNKNWLPNWAIESPKELNQEKRRIIETALDILGTSSRQIHT